MSPIEIIHLFAYDGPNIFGPRPGVLLRVRCDKNRSKRIKAALKDGAQFISMIMAYLDITAEADGDGFMISANFTTPTPAVGQALADYVVAGIRAQALGDEEWDKDTPLFELQKRRRQEALPTAALRLVSEAQRRNAPLLNRPDGKVQLGYGALSWAADPAAVTDATAATLPWDRIGAIPIYAVTGERHRSAVVQRITAQLRTAGHTVSAIDDADYAATAALLADPATTIAVIGLQTQGILRRGLAFDRCTQCIITDLQGECPVEAADVSEWARAVGAPMLVSSGPAIFNAADPALALLKEYAPHGIVSHDMGETP
ncbi:MAG: DUF4938 domain-containing protein [Chloroflexales bacterium]|nr:DUF4938 domain-containing protein [Chloroflexales bacterium]